ncbi:hypothetical protein CAEBREN_20524 [Caenorhabditis brenneri]|uniref:Uncharacterized protein n=1 Tax=Caenorhabditis brenneri TaxID=135651 RepID=G0NWA1_CAEBE|nr:hypothetical protein CAEBREN_20524 [Caenorhabditis brenneri]
MRKRISLSELGSVKNVILSAADLLVSFFRIYENPKTFVMVFCSMKTVIGGLLFLTSLFLCYISWPAWTDSDNSSSSLEFLYRISYPIIQKSENPVNISAENIAIVIILTEDAKRNDYKVSIDFLDEKYDITFYNRHSEQEVAAGSYFVQNTTYSLNLLSDFANYKPRLPAGNVHGTDNDATHIFLAEKLFPQSTIEIESCRGALENSRMLINKLAYTSCIRNIIGEDTDFGEVSVLKKITATSIVKK